MVFVFVGLIINPVNGLMLGSGVAVGTTVGVGVGTTSVGVGSTVGVSGGLVLVGSGVDVVMMNFMTVGALSTEFDEDALHPATSSIVATRAAALDKNGWIPCFTRYSPGNISLNDRRL